MYCKADKMKIPFDGLKTFEMLESFSFGIARSFKEKS